MFRTSPGTAAMLLLAAILAAAHVPPATAGETVTVRLRLEWGSLRPEQWTGLLELSDGTLTNARSLGIDADEPGTLWIDRGSLWIQRKSARLYDGFDITIQASPRAVLSLTLQSTGSPEIQTRERFTLAELEAIAHQSSGSEPQHDSAASRQPELHPAVPGARQPDGHRVVFGNRQATLLIQHAPGTRLDVHFQRSHLVFSPGEAFPLTVAGNMSIAAAETAEAAGRLEWSMARARGGRTVRQGQVPLNREPLSPSTRRYRLTCSTTFAVPAEEGVYDLKLTFAGSGLPPRSRTIQFVVVSPEQMPGSSHQLTHRPGTLVDSLRPADPRLLAMRRTASRLSLHTRFLPSTSRANEDRGHFIPAAGIQPTTSWMAGRLQVRHTGRPHRLVVHAESDGRACIQGVSLLEPNAAGQLLPVGLDSGFQIPPFESAATRPASAEHGTAPEMSDRSATRTDTAPRAEVRKTVVHELLYWPRVHKPVVMLHDFGLGRPATVTRVELYELPTTDKPAAKQATETTTQPAPPAGPYDIPPSTRSRLVGPYLHKPLLGAALGGTQRLDPASGRSLDDWQTFLEPARRLVQLLKARGANACMLAVLADAGTIYPSQTLQPTPRYDSGVFFATGQDPVQKDVVELLFRLFNRDGLQLIPELQFCTPLPELELQLQQNGETASGIELTGRDGRTWRQSRGTVRGRGPYYNPLDPRVQQAIERVVRELAERYGSHPSFGGISLELDSHGYLLLPGLDWGYDDATVARFEQQTGVRLPAATGPGRFEHRATWLTTRVPEKWSAWRSRQLADFHLRLARIVREASPQARCLFTGIRLLHDRSGEDSVRDAVIHSRRLESLLAPLGLDLSLYQHEPGVTVLRPVLQRVPQWPADLAIDRAVNRSPQLARAFPSQPPGVIQYSPPLESRITGFDRLSPWQPAWTWLAAPVGFTGDEARATHAASLADQDLHVLFDGAWTAPVARPSSLQSFEQSLACLPAIPFHPPEIPQPQPVVLRMARHAGRTWLYAVNELGTPVRARLSLDCPPATPCYRVPSGTVETLQPLAAASPAEAESASTTAEKSTASRGGSGSGTASSAVSSRLDFELGPYELVAWRIDDPSIRITSGIARFPAPAILQLRGRLQQLDREIRKAGAQSRPGAARDRAAALHNPGFEESATSGQNAAASAPAGWTIQAAGGAGWQLDSHQPRSGSRALRLTNPAGGSLTASAALPQFQARQLTLRAWLRSSRQGAPVRLGLSGQVGGVTRTQSIQIAADQTWRRYTLREPRADLRGVRHPGDCLAGRRLHGAAAGHRGRSAAVDQDLLRRIAGAR